MKLTLTNFKILHVSGEKTAEFLQSQLTNDVKQVQSSQLQWQAYCSRQGLIQSIFGLWGSEKDYYILLAEELLQSTLALLQKYGVFAKIKFSVLDAIKISVILEAQAEKNFLWKIHHFSNDELQLVWQSNFEEALLSSVQQVSSELILRAALIKHHFPWLNKNTINTFRPHDLNLPALEIVNFKKGCFPGQEIIARMQYRGTPKQGLYIFSLPHRPSFTPGQVLMRNERQIGLVVDAVVVNDVTYLSAMLLHSEKHFIDLCGPDKA